MLDSSAFICVKNPLLLGPSAGWNDELQSILYGASSLSWLKECRLLFRETGATVCYALVFFILQPKCINSNFINEQF